MGVTEMRIAFRLFLCVSIVLLAVGPVRAGTPHLSIYFDPEYTQTSAECHGYEMGYLYIVAEDFNVFIAGLEFSVDYPPEILWLADYDTPPVTLGNTPTGISMAWALPQNGFSPFQVLRVIFFWDCQQCTRGDIPLCVKAHPYSGYVRATRFPDYDFVYAAVQPACICPMCGLSPMCAGSTCSCPEPPVPVEEMSWGKIKELYR